MAQDLWHSSWEYMRGSGFHMLTNMTNTVLKVFRFTSISICFFCCVQTAFAQSDEENEVLAVIEQWAALENDLIAQAELIRDDRVQIGGGIRQTNQKLNLEVQLLRFDAMAEEMGGQPKMIVRIENPLIRIYGNVAVASFVRLFDAAPPGQRAIRTGSAWFSMVLVKDDEDWEIAHHHVSPTNQPSSN
jgi:ketosteroid isomerase-like protein